MCFDRQSKQPGFYNRIKVKVGTRMTIHGEEHDSQRTYFSLWTPGQSLSFLRIFMHEAVAKIRLLKTEFEFQDASYGLDSSACKIVAIQAPKNRETTESGFAIHCFDEKKLLPIAIKINAAIQGASRLRQDGYSYVMQATVSTSSEEIVRSHGVLSNLVSGASTGGEEYKDYKEGLKAAYRSRVLESHIPEVRVASNV